MQTSYIVYTCIGIYKIIFCALFHLVLQRSNLYLSLSYIQKLSNYGVVQLQIQNGINKTMKMVQDADLKTT